MASVVGSTTINGKPAYLMSDGSKKLQQLSTPANANRSTVYGTQSNTNSLPAASLSNGQVGGASIGPGGGGGGGGSSAPSGPSQSDIAREALQSTLNAINGRLNSMKELSTGLISSAGTVRDNTINDIGTTYGGLRSSAETQKTGALAALGKADAETVTNYDNAQGSLNSSAEGTIGKNRALARALGYGNSSYYQDTQDKTRSALLDKTAGLTSERSGKLSDIALNVGDTNKWFAQKSTELANEEGQLKSQAQLLYQDQVGKLNFNQQNYGIDQTDAANQALYEYQSKLDAIANYIGGQKTQLATTAAKADTQRSSIGAFGSGLGNKLSSIEGRTAGITGAQGALPTINTGGFTTTSPSNMAQRDPQAAKNLLEQFLYGYQQPAIA